MIIHTIPIAAFSTAMYFRDDFIVALKTFDIMMIVVSAYLGMVIARSSRARFFSGMATMMFVPIGGQRSLIAWTIIGCALLGASCVLEIRLDKEKRS